MKKLLILFFLFFVMFKSQSQTNSIIDTIEVVRTQTYAKNFAEADRLLTLFTANKNDVNALRLHAQVLYWMKGILNCIAKKRDT